MHLTIDGYGGDRERLSSESLVRSLLDTYPAEINMTKISEPFVLEYTGEKPEDWGVTGFVIIAESHISVHTFPDHGYVWVDIFSCKAFEADGAVDRIVETFGLTHVTTDIHDRGLEFPHAVDKATPVAMLERREVTGALSSGS
ncbi:MAG TPA: S-adenosylmethionine decarboxylase [Dehalococcoidia bacterium]|jgi:S-adenosylmethionine decarboxylase|nr:S-adenosylmethionine decarboxylase [Dehalococcoidia bacterium]